MSVIRVNFLDDFHYGDDAVLLTMDGPGVDIFKAALGEAELSGSSLLKHDGVTHKFHVQEADAADIELEPTHVTWRLDHAKAVEMLGQLASLAAPKAAPPGTSSAGHQYIDISKPAETLILSCDEYVDVVYPWIAPPP